MPHLDTSRTALVVIDPQNWTMGMPLVPHSADTILGNLVRLTHALRASGGILCVTRAAFSAGYADMLRVPVDVALPLPEGGIPTEKLAFRPEIEALGADVTVTKRQWSAFYGTELDLQFRRRDIGTIVLAGVMTNFGVESTARDAWQHNYAVVVAEDCCASLSADMHGFAIEKIFPRVARVRSTAAIIAACGAQTDL
jgi:nicotinamidase-related amidase